MNDYALLSDELDIMKHGLQSCKGMLSFPSISPDEKLFDLANFKRGFLDRMSIEGKIILSKPR